MRIVVIQTVLYDSAHGHMFHVFMARWNASLPEPWKRRSRPTAQQTSWQSSALPRFARQKPWRSHPKNAVCRFQRANRTRQATIRHTEERNRRREEKPLAVYFIVDV